MSDSEAEELVEVTRAEWEELKARVRRLEDQLDDTPTNVSEVNELDSRDAKVIGELEHGRSYSGLQIKKFYKNYTDIRQDKTAKRRAKTLLSRDCFQQDGRFYTFRGE